MKISVFTRVHLWFNMCSRLIMGGTMKIYYYILTFFMLCFCASASLVANTIPVAGNSRITSYNVCYTKLLRIAPPRSTVELFLKYESSLIVNLDFYKMELLQSINSNINRSK